MFKVAAIVAGGAMMADKVVPGKAMAAEPTVTAIDQQAPVAAERAYQELNVAYQALDETDLTQVQTLLKKYQAALDQMKILNNGEFPEAERRVAFLMEQSVALKYTDQDQLNFEVSRVLHASENIRNQDVTTLKSALKLIDQSYNDPTLSALNPEELRVFQDKSQKMKEYILTTLDCLIAASPEAMAAKQTLADQIMYSLVRDGGSAYTPSITIYNNIGDAKVNLHIEIQYNDGHRTVAFNAELHYNSDTKQAEYSSTDAQSSYAKPFNDVIVSDLARADHKKQ